MGRPDEVTTYDQFVEEGMTHEEALTAAAAQMEGKTIILPGGASFTPVLDTALGYAGLMATSRFVGATCARTTLSSF